MVNFLKEVRKGTNPASKIVFSFVEKVRFNLKSWKIYMIHSTRNAGIGLAFLYMTVLNFDNITYGYCLEMCVSELILGKS